jgi:Family of unknown function (DUF6088)
MKKGKNLESKILARIVRKKETVFLRNDFLDLAGYDQIGRALKHLTDTGKLVRIGYGLFAKAKISSLTGETIPTSSLPLLAKEALQRLGVTIMPSKAETEYNEGRSTQIPTGRLIGVANRINRKISFKDAAIKYEYVTPKRDY